MTIYVCTCGETLSSSFIVLQKSLKHSFLIGKNKMTFISKMIDLHFNWNYNTTTKNCACMLNLLAMTSVKVCRLCTNVDKTMDLFSRAGTGEWKTRIAISRRRLQLKSCRKLCINCCIPSLTSQMFFVGGACGKGKRTSGNSCQHSATTLPRFWQNHIRIVMWCAVSYHPS